MHTANVEMYTQNNESSFAERQAVRPLSVIVVGAGIGGLAIGLCMRKTGHHVQILEKRNEVAEVGAGIQLAPNATRILHRLGVLDEAMKHATVLERNSLRRWDNDEELGSIPFVNIEECFGAPLAVIHRADLLHVLLQAAIDCGCEVLEDHKVVDIDQQFLPVRSNGRDAWMSGDLVIAADGVNSFVRKRMAAAGGHDDSLVPAGESAYRFVLPMELIKHDEALMALLNTNQGLRYMGPGGHVMAYPLRKNTLFNVVILRVTGDKKPQRTSWTRLGTKEAMLEHYRGWNPIVRSLIEHAPSSGVLETPMNNILPLPTWVKGKIALAGDACHCMLPYVAQGASNALEDAAALAMALTCTENVDLALEIYQLVRKGRSEWIQASAENTGHVLHLPDGEEQRQRDESIRAAARGLCANPDQWSDKKSHDLMWRFDIMAETINKFRTLGGYGEAGGKKEERRGGEASWIRARL